MRKKGQSAVKRATAAIGFSEAAGGILPQVMLLGKDCVRAQPCERLLEYRQERIRVRMGGACLVVCGSGLWVRVFCRGLLEVCGSVGSIGWEEKA